jgi:hypothetical protein
VQLAMTAAAVVRVSNKRKPMTWEDFERASSGISAVVTAVALLIGAAWTYKRFVREEQNYAHISFTADINFICKQQGYWVVELISIVENHGKVTHQFRDFSFDLFALMHEDQVELSALHGNQAWFRHEIAKGSWRNEKYGSFFIAPGVSAKYSFVTRVPEIASAVMLHSWFKYLDRRNSGHAAERTVRLPDPSV